MKKSDFYSISSEAEFLFKDVIKVNVLTHAKAFQQHKPEDFIQAVQLCESFANETLVDLHQSGDIAYDTKMINVPEGYAAAWKKLSESGILKMLIPGEFGGRNFPETVKIALQEILLAANPSFYLYLMLTLEVANLIAKLGNSALQEKFCKKLYAGDWCGAFSFTEPLTDSDWDAIEAFAEENKGAYSINALKTFIAAGNHNLTENIVHLVLSLVKHPETNQQQLAWFVVPSLTSVSGKLAENNLGIESCHDTIGLNGIPFCTVSFGKDKATIGHLLYATDPEKGDLFNTFNGIRTQMALHGVALSGQVYSQALEFARKDVKSVFKNKATGRKTVTAPLINYPHIADQIMYMKSITEGTRAAVYSIAFFNDCANHGGEEQKEFFSDLTDLYTGVLKVHSTTTGLESIGKGIQVFGKLAYTRENITGRNHRSLQAATLFGGTNEFVAQETLDRIVHHKDGSLIDNLIKQFDSIDTNQARSEPLKEAVRVWQDYIGGIIVLVDDLKKAAEESKGNEEVDPRLSGLWASRIVRLIGDVILCYHLVVQAIEAENKLNEMDVNFFNLQQEVSRVPEAMNWYDKILAAEYFALNVLSENEGNIRIIQRSASSALDAFFSGQTQE